MSREIVIVGAEMDYMKYESILKAVGEIGGVEVVLLGGSLEDMQEQIQGLGLDSSKSGSPGYDELKNMVLKAVYESPVDYSELGDLVATSEATENILSRDKKFSGKRNLINPRYSSKGKGVSKRNYNRRRR